MSSDRRSRTASENCSQRDRAMQACPFKVGDDVIYQPSFDGRGKIIMTDLANLKAGERYKVAGIDEDAFIVVEGFENSIPSGLYWTEFVAADVD